MADLPEGYHFSPRDYEFISYLRRRKNREPQPFNHQFLEIDLYNLKHPSQLFEGTSEKELFLFTTLKKLKKSSRRVIRIAGDGTWKSQHSDPVHDPYDCSSRNRRAIGENTSLKFETNKAAAAASSSSSSGDGFRYIMHEFSLPKSDDYLGVACVIRREPPLKSCSLSFHAEKHQEVIPQHGQKRSRDDQEFGGLVQEEYSEPYSKNMRLLQCDSDGARLLCPVASSELEQQPFAASSSVSGSSLSELPAAANEDLDYFSQWLEEDVLIEEGSETTNYGAELDNFLKELQSVELENPDECSETNTMEEPCSTKGETSHDAPAVEQNALAAYDQNKVYLGEPHPVATDQPHHEANLQQEEGYGDASCQWSGKPFLEPDEGYMDQVFAAPEWQESLTYTPDPVDYCEDLAAFF